MSYDAFSSGVPTGTTDTQSESEQFKILIASDVHLGYAERSALRGDDSFRSFEEVLQAAAKHDVDLILLAGDLFHVNKPSIPTINRASALIRKYCFGQYDDKSMGPRFRIRGHKNANFLDPNLKVRFPIFTIHGNHDDPTGVNQTSVIDLLDSTGLVNYIGKRNHVEDVVLKPIVLEKGRTKIALYGLGSMHEERLHHLIQTDKFNYMTPDEDDLSQYFKVVLVHQNRIPRPNTKYLDPNDLDELPDLVIWGHEHGCVGELEYFEPCNFSIFQPGSTVATSLCEAEAGDKCYAIMTVNYDSAKEKPRYKVRVHKLETVRPFLTKTINADDLLAKKTFKTTEDAQEYLYNCAKSEIKEMISTVRSEYHTDMLPLIRLRVEYSDKDQQFDVKRIGRDLDSKIANPDELIRFVKRSDANAEYRKVIDEQENFNMVEMMSILDDDVMKQQIQIGSIMSEYFGNLTNEQHKMGLFAERYLTTKVVDFVEKDAADVFADLVDNYKEGIISMLGNYDQLDFDDLKSEIRAVKEKVEEDQDLMLNFDKVIQKAKAARVLKNREASAKERKSKKETMDDSFGDDSDWDAGVSQLSTSKVVAPMAASPKKRGRPRKNPPSTVEEIEIPELEPDSQSPSQPKRRGRPPRSSQNVSPPAASRGQVGRGTRPKVASTSYKEDADSDESLEFIEESDEEYSPKKPVASSSRGGRGGGGGSRGRGRGRGRPSKQISVWKNNDDDDDDASEEEEGQKDGGGKITSFFSKRRRN